MPAVLGDCAGRSVGRPLRWVTPAPGSPSVVPFGTFLARPVPEPLLGSSGSRRAGNLDAGRRRCGRSPGRSEPMVDVVRRRSRRKAADRSDRRDPLGQAAGNYATLGWPVCVGAHLPLDGLKTGRACSCDRVGCPAPGAHPVSPTWQMQATVDTATIRQWWATRPGAGVILVTGRVFDV